MELLLILALKYMMWVKLETLQRKFTREVVITAGHRIRTTPTSSIRVLLSSYAGAFTIMEPLQVCSIRAATLVIATSTFRSVRCFARSTLRFALGLCPFFFCSKWESSLARVGDKHFEY